ncbi:uncharacterized membrane protein At3g27390-like [Diospyros lotus]|uniref:uncharacterized membrane protein At3g27390-like n=1 Tax=Diospyros lotus TaxID=55363 RepID=UPI00225AB705|nr:uncharacterized membrane protein At3g27390-like [Diospyros lotus]
MEPPRGFWLSLGRFICFLPYFVGLLILGLIKGIIFCPLICLIMTIGNSAIILGLWPVHVVWTNYSILRSIKFRPVLKLLLCFLATVLLLLWPVIGIVGSIIGGAAYGLLSPMFATFKAVGEGTTDKFFHCIYDGTWDTVRQSFTLIRDFYDVCYHSYKEVMSDLQHQGPQEGKCHKIRLLHLPGAILAGILGFLVDVPVISLVAICKSPIMLIKGWHRLFHDCIGREGPFLETICVPFAGLAILLWPLAVAGAVLASMVSSIFLGAYAGAVVYQESSLWNGLCYIVASLSIYDEYSNDVLDLQGGPCFPRPRYRRKDAEPEPDSRASSFSRPASFRRSVSRTPSIKAPMVDLKPFELLDSLFEECKRHGEMMVFEGLITVEDIVNAKSNKDSGKVISIGLPAYCLLQALLRSIKANSAGILLSNNVTEITSANRPKDVIFDWFFNPLLIIKDQIKAQNLSEAEEDYFCKLVLLSGDPERLKKLNIGSAPESELRQAELHALARRLRGITKSISRYPTFRRRFEDSIKIISEELAKKNEASKSAPERQVFTRSRSAFARMFSQRSFKNRTDSNGPPVVTERELEIA